jgi:hypothetical protein
MTPELAACMARWKDAPPLTDDDLIEYIEKWPFGPEVAPLVATVLTQRERIDELEAAWGTADEERNGAIAANTTQREEIERLRHTDHVAIADLFQRRLATSEEIRAGLAAALGKERAEIERLTAMIGKMHTHRWERIGGVRPGAVVCVCGEWRTWGDDDGR